MMWDILILPHWHVHVALCLDNEDNILWSNNSIRFICILTCEYWIPRLKPSGYDLGWALLFEPGFSFVMVLRSLVWYPLGYSINMFLGLALRNYFVTWEVYLVGVSLGTLAVLIISIWEGYLVVLLLVLPLGSLL